MPSFTTHDLRLAYSDTGEGVPLVLVHGFPLNRTMWQPQLAALSSSARLISLDLRGHGESDAPLWRYRMEDFAQDIAALMDHLQLPRIVLAGLSMGGYAAFAFARLFPERLHGLVLCDTRAQADTDDGRRGRFQMAQTAHTQGAAAIAETMLPKLLAPGTWQRRPELVASTRSMIESMRLGGLVGDLIAMADRPDSTAQLAELRCPTLVIVGEEDQATPVHDARFMAERIPGARLEIIPGAGHLPNVEQPERFNDCLQRFLQGLPTV